MKIVSPPWMARMLYALPLIAGGLWGWWYGITSSSRLTTWALEHEDWAEFALLHGLPGAVGFFYWITVLLAAFALASGILVAAGRKQAPRFMRATCWAVYVWVLLVSGLVMHWTGIVYQAELQPGEFPLDEVLLFFWRWDIIAPWLLLALFTAWYHVSSCRASCIQLFGLQPRADGEPGDHILENIRSGGEDRRRRNSTYTSVFLHLLVIVLIPWLMQLGGCVEDYRIPQGSGDPVVALVQMVKPKKEKKQQLVVRADSAILFNIPDLDDSEVLREVKEVTELTYTADPNVLAGRMGAGGGQRGGWPDGMEDARVRFVRLEYRGTGWDNGMDVASAADINFLQEFSRLTGFRVAERGESHPIRMLRRYSPGMAPPFVYMTGLDTINIPPADMIILRDYLLNGGMLFADAGSPRWDRSFRQFMTALFPNDPLRIISDDDPIYQMPYSFPRGAPPLWHLGGMKPMGVKVDGRWVVFYHPGHINAAWKTGHAGLSPELTRGAYQMGVNIVYYAFTHYLEATRNQRKR